MLQRRQFLGSIVVPTASALAACGPRLRPDADDVVRALAATPGDATKLSADERFWAEVGRAFTPDRGMINLNNGGVCPSPAPVQRSMQRYLEHANTAPAWVLWQLQEPGKENVRAGLARMFGCDPEEIAITRNASESLEIVQLGLDLQRGDEIVTSDMDYPRMITTWKQRERRDGVVLKQIELPVPADDDGEIVRRFEAAITDRTRVLHVCHVINLNGQILPVKQLVAMGRKRGIAVIVDGAHSFAHVDFRHADLDCDYYATSLHKFLFAPHGTGLLYVRQDKIPGIWPMMAAPVELDADIRKFEEIGTHPAANILAIGDALAFHEAIGAARKYARQLHLRDHWAKRLASNDKFRLHTSLAKGRANGVATVEIRGVDTAALAAHLWEKHRIFTVGIVHPRFSGLRISPTIYNTKAELDRFCAVMERVSASGLPA
jgi:selenocysteine lyase/cysteine desulfurase